MKVARAQGKKDEERLAQAKGPTEPKQVTLQQHVHYVTCITVKIVTIIGNVMNKIKYVIITS